MRPAAAKEKRRILPTANPAKGRRIVSLRHQAIFTLGYPPIINEQGKKLHLQASSYYFPAHSPTNATIYIPRKPQCIGCDRSAFTQGTLR